MSPKVSEFDQAVSLQRNGESKKAKKILEKILELQPDHFDSIFLLSIINYQLGLFDDALKYNDVILKISPNFLQGYNNRAIILKNNNKFNEALISINKAISLNPNFAEFYNNQANILKEIKRFDEALLSINKAISLNPNFAEFYNNQANILKEIKRFDEALLSINKAISLNPNFAEFYNNLGTILQDLRRHEHAISAFEKAININPNIPFIKGRLLHSKMSCCNWNDIDKIYKDIFYEVENGNKSADPFGYQAICVDENNLRLCAEIYSKKYHPINNNPSKNITIVNKSKINIAYLCGEFREQATSILLTEVWENHNKNIFKTFALDNGWDDNSPRRKRIKKSFDEFIDISKLSDDAVVKLIKEKNIHILINLNCFFGLQRNSVFAYRPAQIQINFLGFPGTLGAKYIDYLIADETVIPLESQRHYSEKIIYMPNSYQPSDTKRVKSDKLFKREQFGLPENAFVFVCFNNSYKITPQIFDIWMKILQSVNNSVLWLIETEEIVCRNLKLEALKRNIDASRIVFTKRMKLEDHLLRHDLGDLFLDTLPYNAHTTANDSLWAGLPVLTCLGNTFPGRVGASLLNSVGLADLVTFSLEDYKKKAVYFGNNPNEITKIKNKLNKNKFEYPLFNQELYTKNLENIFVKLYKEHYL
jgi:predicted O-linked N-acetylglucosamine transferase (SPINDLY family)